MNGRKLAARTILAGLAVAVAHLAPVEASAAVARAELLIDATTGKVIESNNANALHAPASLTKMMTLFLVFEALDGKRLTMDQRLPISAHAAGQPATNLNLRAGTTITVHDAILAMIIRSANDAAVVAAEALGGTESQFAQIMTKKARELGMSKTTFRDASGLPAKGQLTTAWDMALLGRALQKRYPQYYPLFATLEFEHNGVTYTTHNKLLGRYTGVDGIKTGYTRASMFNLVTSAERNGHRVIGVVLGSPTGHGRDLEMMALLDRGFTSTNGTMLAKADDAKPDAGVVTPAAANNNDTAEVARDVAAATSEAAAATDTTDEEPPQGSITEAWGIQVGAFGDHNSASGAVVNALRRQPRLLSDAETVIVPVAGSKGVFYRARLYGLSEEQARQACVSLRTRKSNACMVVSPDGATYKPVVASVTPKKK
jgi:D-alanyl-D-alanine carboxypeptidase